MRRCTAVCIWLSCSLIVACSIGCNMLRPKDPLSAYELPDEIDPNQGMLSDVTDGLMASAKASVGLGPNEAAAKEQFEVAMGIYKNASQLEGRDRLSEFDKAAKAFSRAAARWPKSSVEEDALFYRAESLFFAERYPKAESEFGGVVSKYTSSRHIDAISRRRFQIAKYWLDHHEEGSQPAIVPNFTSRDRPTFDNFGNAIKILERIRLDDPTGELADDATMLAANACYNAGKIYRADELLNDLRRSFPNSEHQYRAHMIGLQCKIQLYQGPSYDAGPLDDAEELVRQMRRQFPGESANDTEYLAKAYKDVRMNRALREMSLARYRDRRQEYRAARTQYERVAREFADTSLAATAQRRLEELGGAPDLPPQRLEWLARAFPTSNEDQPLIATKPGTTQR